MSFDLYDFVKESNRIEGIHRAPLDEEIHAHDEFMDLASITVSDMEKFVAKVAGAKLRRNYGMNVRVGSHVAPTGGPEIETLLQAILDNDDMTAFNQHKAYETLHPFMDGNGRSGRVLWLWTMGGIDNAPLGFLHHFYYQTLGESR